VDEIQKLGNTKSNIPSLEVLRINIYHLFFFRSLGYKKYCMGSSTEESLGNTAVYNRMHVHVKKVYATSTGCYADIWMNGYYNEG
jgi:hypothetical protein